MPLPVPAAAECVRRSGPVCRTPAGGWLVSVNHGFDDYGLAGFEKVLLHDLPGSSPAGLAPGRARPFPRR
jgi:hypothetical protein